jgi:hypothetical protein
MLTKQLWVLVLHTMIPVGVENDLRVRQVLPEDERVHRINDHVVAAVHHERGLSDLLQVSIGIFRRSASFLGDAGVVKQDQFAVLGKSLGQCGIPVIHGPGKVHEEEQRDVDHCAEAAVGEVTVREANAGGLNELGRRGLVRVVTHKKSPVQ